MASEFLRVSDLVLDTAAHLVRRSSKEIRLNRKEFSLLEYLMENAGKVLTRAQILERVWGMDLDPFSNTVDVHMRFLRKKVDEGYDEKLLKTVHGHGYKIAA